MIPPKSSHSSQLPTHIPPQHPCSPSKPQQMTVPIQREHRNQQKELPPFPVTCNRLNVCVPTMHFCCCCSVPQSCPTLCDAMNCSMPGFPVLHYISWSLLKLTSIESLMPSNHLVLFHLLLPSIFPSIRSFPMSWLFTSGGQSIGASASASVLPMNIQGWLPLELSCLIFLQSKGLSRVFSSSIVQRINSSVLGLLYGPTLTRIHDYWKKP